MTTAGPQAGRERRAAYRRVACIIWLVLWAGGCAPLRRSRLVPSAAVAGPGLGVPGAEGGTIAVPSAGGLDPVGVGPAAAAPDRVDEQVRAALVHLFSADRAALDADCAFFRRVDLERERLGQPPTGLADQVLDLRNSLIEARGDYLDALRDALDEEPDPVLRERIRWRIEQDEVVTAERLLRDDRHNRIATIVNDAVRPIGQWTLPAVATINPILLGGAVVDAVASTAANLWRWGRTSAEEREALARYRAHLRRGADAPARAEAAPIVGRLRRKVAAADCERALEAGKRAAAAGDAELASFHLRVASSLSDCEAASADARAQLEKDEADRQADADASLWPREDLRAVSEGPPSEAPLLAALLRADPQVIRAEAEALRAHDPDGDLADEAAYAETVAADLEGEHEEALDALRQLARRQRDTNMGRRAAALLRDPTYDRFGALRKAIAAHRRARVRYVLFGQRPTGRTALYSTAHVGAEGLGAVQSLGILNVIGIATRAVQSWRHDPVPNRAIIELGEELLAREPESPHAPAVHAMLAEAYQRDGDYDRALFHFGRTPSPSARQVARLRAKAAGALVDAAESGGDSARRRELLTLAAERYPGTRAAERAQGALDDLGPAGGDLAITPERLRTTPALAGLLGVPPAWLDGAEANGELTSPGIRVLSGGRATVALATPGGAQEESLDLDPERMAAVVALVREADYRNAAAQARAQHEGGRFERLIPFFIQGTIGERGVSVYPGVKLRRNTSPTRALYE